MALGELKLKIKYFYNLTPRQFSNTERGFRKQEDILSKERWIMTRKIMWAAAFPHLKKVEERELLPFPWDETELQEMSIEESKKLKDGADRVKEFYKNQDEKRKSQSV